MLSIDGMMVTPLMRSSPYVALGFWLGYVHSLSRLYEIPLACVFAFVCKFNM